MNGPAAATFEVQKARTAAAAASAVRRATAERYPRIREFTPGAGHLRRDLRVFRGRRRGAVLAFGQQPGCARRCTDAELSVPRRIDAAGRPCAAIHPDRPG